MSIHIIDTIKVQWAIQGKAGSPKNIRVLMVIEFNGEILSEALDKTALNAILGVFSKIEDTQGDLLMTTLDKRDRMSNRNTATDMQGEIISPSDTAARSSIASVFATANYGL
ncbi:hypothetical protein [Sinorhizobium fredii]|uniref:hypothetical protein n=1 Tax=Rhizobium fredii TaxID=380 RepID=UPI0012FE5B80|nr:hypothetical protein [Sinorhizobium fredii]